jgi:dimethylargininase
VAFVSRSQRTNSSGIRQLSGLLAGLDYEIRTLDLPSPHLHVGGAMSVVGPKSILCCRGLFPEAFFEGFDVIKIACPEATSANMICLGDHELIAEQRDVRSARALAKAGFHVHRLDLSEFVKGRGGPTCLILPVDRG